MFLRPARLILLTAVCAVPVFGARAQFADSAPDSVRVKAETLGRIADSLLSAGNAAEALRRYHKALKFYRQVNQTGEIAHILANIGRAHGRIIDGNQEWMPEYQPETERKEIYYRISKISDRRRDTVIAQVEGGTLDGIVVGGKGEVSPVNTKDAPVRNEWSLAKAEVVAASQNRATVALSQLDKGPALSVVREGDIVILPVQVPKKDYRSIFFDLAALRIWFLDLSRDTLYHPRQLLYEDGQRLESDLLEAMANDVRQTVPVLQPYLKDNPSWGDTLKGGIFEGMSLMEALEKCTSADILSFLQFVKSFPAKYMGLNWKINETFATWVLNNTPLGDESLRDPTVLLRLVSRPSFTAFVKDSRAYILDRGAIGSWNTIAESRAETGKYDEADQINDLALRVAGVLKSDSSKALILLSRGRIAEWEKEPDSAMVWYNQSIALSPEWANSYYFRGRLSSARGRYDDAIKDMRKVESLVPSFAGAYGAEGWYLILHGKFLDARGPAIKATELDTTSMAWTVNLGHTYLLEGDTATARKYYVTSLRRIRSVAEFEEGPIADFELFIKNGWKPDLARQMMDWMRSEYDAVYQYDVTSLEHWQAGKDHLALGEFAQAGDRFEKSYLAEMKSREPKEVWIMVEAEYAGSAFMKSMQFARSLESYKTAMVYSQNPVNGGSTSSYLRSISEVYSALGNAAKSREYEQKAVELERKLSALGATNNLYVLAIGIDDALMGGGSRDSADASAIVDAFRQKGKGVFQESFLSLAVNARASKDSVESALGSIAKRSKPGDTFVLFFAGPTFSTASGFYLKPFMSKHRTPDTSSTSGAISAWQLRTWLSKIPAQKQLVVLDAPATSFIADYVSRSAREESYFEGTGRNLTILCPAETPAEAGDQNLGLFARVLVEGLQGRAAAGARDTVITAKELDAFLTRTLSQSDFGIQSYTRGKDFPVAYVQIKTKAGGDRTPPGCGLLNRPQCAEPCWSPAKRVLP